MVGFNSNILSVSPSILQPTRPSPRHFYSHSRFCTHSTVARPNSNHWNQTTRKKVGTLVRNSYDTPDLNSTGAPSEKVVAAAKMPNGQGAKFLVGTFVLTPHQLQTTRTSIVADTLAIVTTTTIGRKFEI